MAPSHFDRRRFAALAAITVLVAPALAGHSQSTIAAPGGFFQAGATDNTASLGGSFGMPGADMQNFIVSAGASNFQENAFAGNASAAASATLTIGPVHNNAAGSAAMGLIRLAADNAAPNANMFPCGAVNGGWKDSLVVSNPALTGQPGVLVFQVFVSGTLHAAGFAGRTFVMTSGFKNNIELTMNPWFDPGNSDPISTDRQRALWGTSTSDIGEVSNRVINDAITMAVPITFGQSFTLGVYAAGTAGMRSSSAVMGSSESNFDFSQTIRWGGVVAVIHKGAPVGGSSVSSAAGVDWTDPVLPCPGDTNGDNVVDFADLNNVLSDYLMSGPGLAGDANGDGVVNFEDLNLVLSFYLVAC